MEKNQKTEKTSPQTLEVGMEVHAVCMGCVIGEYVVTRVGKRNATMKVKGEDPKEGRVIFVDCTLGDNGEIKVLKGGLDIQAVNYFVQPYVRS